MQMNCHAFLLTIIPILQFSNLSWQNLTGIVASAVQKIITHLMPLGSTWTSYHKNVKWRRESPNKQGGWLSVLAYLWHIKFWPFQCNYSKNSALRLLLEWIIKLLSTSFQVSGMQSMAAAAIQWRRLTFTSRKHVNCIL